MFLQHARLLAKFTRNILLGQILSLLLTQLLPGLSPLAVDAVVGALLDLVFPAGLRAWKRHRAAKLLAGRTPPTLPPPDA